MLKRMTFSLLCIAGVTLPNTILAIIMPQSYAYDTSRDDHIAQLKLKLTILHAEETVLKNTLQFDLNKYKLYKSLILIRFGCFLGRISELMSVDTSCWINDGYPFIIFIYCWIRLMRYIFVRLEIDSIERELDRL